MLYEISIEWRDDEHEARESSWTVEAPAYRVTRDGRVLILPALTTWAIETVGPDADGHAGRHVYAITIARYFPPTFTRDSRQYPESSGVRSTLVEHAYPEGLHAHLTKLAAARASLAADAVR